MSGIHYLQITDDRKQSPLRRKCIDSLKAIVRDGIDTYELICCPWYDDPLKMVRIAEDIRFDKAKTISNLCYVDTDCFIHEAFIPPEDNKPYFGEYAYNDSDPGLPDIFYFFVNGNTNYFIKNFLNRNKPSDKYTINMQHLRELTNFGLIPNKSYVHCYSTTNVLVEMMKAEKPKAFNIDQLELASMKKTLEQMIMNFNVFNELRKQNG